MKLVLSQLEKCCKKKLGSLGSKWRRHTTYCEIYFFLNFSVNTVCTLFIEGDSLARGPKLLSVYSRTARVSRS